MFQARNKINAQLDAAYDAGKFAVIVTNLKLIPVRNRDMIRAANDGKGVYIKSGSKEVYAFCYQVKFAK